MEYDEFAAHSLPLAVRVDCRGRGIKHKLKQKIFIILFHINSVYNGTNEASTDSFAEYGVRIYKTKKMYNNNKKRCTIPAHVLMAKKKIIIIK